MAESVDYPEIIRAWTRERFVAEHDFPFLVGRNPVAAAARRRQSTGTNLIVDFEAAMTSRIRINNVGPRVLQVYAVRKVGADVSGMITVGRSASNDIVIDDVEISKFHAFFVEGPSGIELVDAGSTNGTCIEGVRLQANRPGSRLHSGAHVQLASMEFLFLDAGACFDRVRELDARGP